MADFTTQVIEEFRANEGRVGGMFEGAPMILITHTGRRSGRRITTPLVHTRDGDDYVIIASKAGADEHPLWYLNIKADPNVHVEVGTEAFPAVARVLEDGEERDRLFAAHAELMPNFKEYEQKTERVIPVVVLSRVQPAQT
jgi:deazaflavin-dependent oxidoreductase (nitroreductase family)